MEQVRYDFLLEARTPIAHHTETFGNTSVIMRRKVRQTDGSWVSVPTITADTMRHGLREAAALVYLDLAGVCESLTEGALRLLFAGGMMTGKGETRIIKLDQYREWIELYPPLALLGGCMSNRVIPGKINVDDAVLVCKEQAHHLPPWVIEWHESKSWAMPGMREHIEEEQRVRGDPTLNPGKRLLLTSGEQLQIEARLERSEEGDPKAKSSLMPRRFERLAQGSLFYWSIVATIHDKLELDTLHTMLAAFLRAPQVGGKRATGHGNLRPVSARKFKLARPAELPEIIDAHAIGEPAGVRFASHVRERAERIRSFLDTVDA